MIHFPIKFIFNGKEHTASAHKISAILGASAQWHIFDITPNDYSIPNPWMFIHDPAKEMFTFSHSPDYFNMAKPILDAVYKECQNRGLDIY